MKLLSFQAAVAAVLAAASLADAVVYTNVAGTVPFTSSDILRSPDSQFTLTARNNVVQLSYLNFPVRSGVCNETSTLGVGSGRVFFQATDGNRCAVTPGIARYFFDSSEGGLSYSGGIGIQGYSSILGSTTQSAMVNNATQSSRVHFFVVDSGYDPVWDLSGALDGITGLNRVSFNTSDPNGQDTHGHGTQIATILKGRSLGLARGAGLTTIKISRPSGGNQTATSELQLVRALERAATTTVTQSAKIVVLNAALGSQFTSRVRCAVQKAFNAGIHIVAAAGNDNQVLAVRDDRIFTVGAASLYPTGPWSKGWEPAPISNHGADVDIWAPGQITDESMSSTTYAAAQVAAVLARAIDAWPTQLATNPGRAYQYLSSRASTTILAANSKTTNTGKGSNRFLQGAINVTPATTSYVASPTDYCTPIFGNSNPTWSSITSGAGDQNLNYLHVPAAVYPNTPLTYLDQPFLQPPQSLPLKSGETFWNNRRTDGSGWRMDPIYSPDQQSGLIYDMDTMNVTFARRSIPILRFPCQVDDVGLDEFGRLFGIRKYGLVYGEVPFNCYINTVAGPVDQYKMQTTDDGVLQILNSSGNVFWSFEIPKDLYSDWSLDVMSGIPKYNVSRFNGFGTRTYMLDSGVSLGDDGWSAVIGKVKEAGCITGWMGSFCSWDAHNHGTRLGLMLTSYDNGLLQDTSLITVKVTDGDSRQVSEKTLVDAFRVVQQDPYSGFKLINLAVSFSPMTDVIRCAFQWAYHSNISVITGVANSNQLQSVRNPYALTVGAVFWNSSTPAIPPKISDYSNFGASVDLWAPGQYVDTFNEGTSFAVTYATAALATAYSTWPNHLKANLGQVYQWFLNSANTTWIPANDAKVVASPNAGTRMARLTFPTAPVLSGTFVPSNTPNFCGSLNSTFSATVPNWNALLQRASSALTGNLITSTGWAPPRGASISPSISPAPSL